MLQKQHKFLTHLWASNYVLYMLTLCYACHRTTGSTLTYCQFHKSFDLITWCKNVSCCITILHFNKHSAVKRSYTDRLLRSAYQSQHPTHKQKPWFLVSLSETEQHHELKQNHGNINHHGATRYVFEYSTSPNISV